MGDRLHLLSATVAQLPETLPMPSSLRHPWPCPDSSPSFHFPCPESRLWPQPPGKSPPAPRPGKGLEGKWGLHTHGEKWIMRGEDGARGNLRSLEINPDATLCPLQKLLNSAELSQQLPRQVRPLALTPTPHPPRAA